MRQAAMRCSRCTCPTCQDEREQFAQLMFEVADLRAERPADRGAWAALVEAADGQWFSSVAMIKRATVDGGLYLALTESGIETVREMASWLRRHRDTEIAGVRLIRGRRVENGFLWRFSAETCNTTA